MLFLIYKLIFLFMFFYMYDYWTFLLRRPLILCYSSLDPPSFCSSSSPSSESFGIGV